MDFGVHAWVQKAVPTLRAISVSAHEAYPAPYSSHLIELRNT
jgi:hypothetical protein